MTTFNNTRLTWKADTVEFFDNNINDFIEADGYTSWFSPSYAGDTDTNEYNLCVYNQDGNWFAHWSDNANDGTINKSFATADEAAAALEDIFHSEIDEHFEARKND